MNLSDRFIVELTGSTLDTLAWTRREQRRAKDWLLALQVDLDTRLALIPFDDRGPAASGRVRRMEELADKVERMVTKAAAVTQPGWNLRLSEFGSAEATHLDRTYRDIFKADITSINITPRDLRALPNNIIIDGVKMEEFWGGMKAKTARRVKSTLRTGYLSGQTNDEIVRNLRGTPTGRRKTITLADGRKRRVNEYSGGILSGSRKDTETLVRSSVMAMSSEVDKSMFEDNGDLIKGYGAITTLDNRTSKICIARTGGAWDPETGEPLEQSATDERFPGFPPWHPNCRSRLYPITKSWDELIREAGGELSDGDPINTVPNNVRASMDGRTGDVKTFEDFLERRTAAQIKEQIGGTAYSLWKEGKITLQQLIDGSGNERTVSELIRIASRN